MVQQMDLVFAAKIKLSIQRRSERPKALLFLDLQPENPSLGLSQKNTLARDEDLAQVRCTGVKEIFGISLRVRKLFEFKGNSYEKKTYTFRAQ